MQSREMFLLALEEVFIPIQSHQECVLSHALAISQEDNTTFPAVPGSFVPARVWRRAIFYSRTYSYSWALFFYVNLQRTLKNTQFC